MPNIYLETSPGTFEPWDRRGYTDEAGDFIVCDPVMIEGWSDEERAAHDLYIPAPADPMPAGKVVAGETAQRVGGIVRLVYELADAPPPPVPDLISDRQFFQALAKPPYGLIPKDQAMAAVQTGTIPPAIVDLIDIAKDLDLFPPGMERFDIDILIAGAVEFRRHHPATLLLTALWGWTDEDTDAFFRFAEQLG